MKEKMTTVLLPRGRKQEENFVIVSVNGRSWKIMRGVEVRVPVCAAGLWNNAFLTYRDYRARTAVPEGGARALRLC